MTDLELSKQLREIGSEPKVRQALGMSKLKNRIETDLFVSDAADNESDVKIHKTNLMFLNTCIDKYKENHLKKEDMEKLNILNKKYKRIKRFEV